MFSRTIVYELEEIVGKLETITVEMNCFTDDVEISAKSESGEAVPAELTGDQRQMLVFSDVPLKLGDQEIIGFSLSDETFAAMQTDIRLMEKGPDEEPGNPSMSD